MMELLSKVCIKKWRIYIIGFNHQLQNTDYFILFVSVKLIGKLQDGTIFVKKGHGEEEELFEFKTDEGNNCWWLRISPFLCFLFSRWTVS